VTERLRITVCGYIVRGPLGGLAWHHLQYVLGLSRMGHEVFFVDDSDNYASCYHPDTHALSTDPSYGLAFCGAAFDRLGLDGQWAYFDEHSNRWLGPAAAGAAERAREADLLLDVSAVNPVRDWWSGIPARVLIDTDPAFTQLRHLADPKLHELAADAHTHFATYAENVGTTATLPDDGFRWFATRQPVVLDAWPVRPAPRDGAWTTVMQWNSYPERKFGGTVYGMKSKSFKPYFDLPSRVRDQQLVLAIGSDTAPRKRLAAEGWEVLDPISVTRDPWQFQNFVQQSKGEFGVAKHGYVVSRSGWFSERTANYLASGRPAIVEDSGFTDWMNPTAGLMAFSTPEEAVESLRAVDVDYDAHCMAAREVAATYFDHRLVLGQLLDTAMGQRGDS
jgi:hypothetical protein